MVSSQNLPKRLGLVVEDQADTRAWANLPNTIQMAVVDRPQTGILALSDAAGRAVAQVPLAEGVNTLVLVKAAGTTGQPAVYVQPLPAQAPAGPLPSATRQGV